MLCLGIDDYGKEKKENIGKTKHIPIMIEQGSFQFAFIAKDLSAENKDSFLVVLSHYDNT